MKNLLIFVVILLLFGVQVNAAQIPIINFYVTDNVGILSPSAKAELEKTLMDLEKPTNGVQYIIYIDKEYPKEYSLEEYTLKIAETNKIGKKGNDNGILLYVAIDDKAYRWEVGYGVESTLSASLLGRISREVLVPNFKQGNYEKGILETVDITGRILLGSNDPDIVKLKGEPTPRPFSEFFKMILIAIAIFLIISLIFYFASKATKNMPKKKYNDNYYKDAANGIFIGGFGGGFGGSGGFGGFSGGGGTFGGGGGSGRW